MHDIKSWRVSELIVVQRANDLWSQSKRGFWTQNCRCKKGNIYKQSMFLLLLLLHSPPPPLKKKKLAKLSGFLFIYPASRGFSLAWLSVFPKSFAWLVCRIVGLFTSREKPLQQTVSHVNKPTTWQSSQTNDFVTAKSHAREKPLLEGYVSLKTCVKSAQNRSLSSEICFF